jgi:choline dehydrogenase-like flavoprotein
MSIKICIIGCGTYGSYLIKGLIEKYGNDVQITAIEIGSKHTKNEAEMGLAAESDTARAGHQGRYFGLGGTSARWGGQVLFFDNRDNPLKQRDWDTIIKINTQYRRLVLQKLLGDVPKIDDLLNDKGIEKTGIWLKYTKRNMYKALNKTHLSTVKIIENQRVVDFTFENNKIIKVLCQPNTSFGSGDTEGVLQTIEADVFYLTAGAIESCRLLLDINEKYHIISSTDLGKNYGDHLSVELFKIKNRPFIDNTDFLPRFVQGSMVTKRWVVTTKNGRVGFAHPVLNKEVKVFRSIKQMLFGKQKIDFSLLDLIEGFEFLLRFAFNVLILKKMYAHRNRWSLQLEMEQPFPNQNSISLSEQTDKFGQKAARLNWQVSPEDRQAVEEIKGFLKQKLDAENIEYSTVSDPNMGGTKIEDVYHPSGFMRLGHDENAVLDTNCRVRGIENLFHFSTAMFPSVRSASPTAAGFCFIEHHLECVFPYLKNNFKKETPQYFDLLND